MDLQWGWILFQDAVEYSCAFLDEEEERTEEEGKDEENEEAQDEEDGDEEAEDKKDGDTEDRDEEDDTEQSDAAGTSSGELPAVTPGGDLGVVGGLQKSSNDSHYFYQGIELTSPKSSTYPANMTYNNVHKGVFCKI